MSAFQLNKHELIDKVSIKYPCRKEIVGRLYNYFGHSSSNAEVVLPACVYLYGDIRTGKSVILAEFFKQLSTIKSVIIDCIECYTSKIIYETILNELFEHELSADKNYAPRARCENARDFLEVIKLLPLENQQPIVIVFDNAERLRDVEANVLELFLRLQEMTSLNVCCLFVSIIPMEKLYPKESFLMPITLYWPKYSQNDILQILKSKFGYYKEVLLQRLTHNPKLNKEEIAKRTALIHNLNINFFENYLNIFLSIFFRTCRDLKELMCISRDCFEKYCEPILDGTVEPNDARKLYTNILNTLKTVLVTIYKRIEHSSSTSVVVRNNK